MSLSNEEPKNEPVRDMVGVLRRLAGCRARAGPHRQVACRADPGLAGARDAGGPESTLACRDLALGCRRARAGDGPLDGPSDRGVSFRPSRPAFGGLPANGFDPAGLRGTRGSGDRLEAGADGADPSHAGRCFLGCDGEPRRSGSCAALCRGPRIPMGSSTRLVVVASLAGRRLRAGGPADRGEPGPGAGHPAVVSCS